MSVVCKPGTTVISCTEKTTEQRPVMAEDDIPHMIVVNATELTLTSYYHKHCMGVVFGCFLAPKHLN